MTYNKITETEFKNWTEEFEKIYLARLARMPEDKEKEKQKNAVANFIVDMKAGNTFAWALEILSSWEIATSPNNPYRYTKVPEWGNLTFEEWLTKIKNRIEEHHRRRRNYSVNAADIFARFNENKAKIGEDEDYRDKVLSFVDRDDPEGREMLWRIFYFINELEKIGLAKSMAETNEENVKKLIQQFPYLFEDLVKTIEEGKKKLEDYEAAINSNQRPSSNNPNKEKTNQKISQLEAERDRLQGEIDRVKNDSQISEDERKRKQKELEKELAARETEIASLRQGQKPFLPPQKSEDDSSKKKNNNKLNWAIGLGIAAVVIALLCFIVLLARPSRRD